MTGFQMVATFIVFAAVLLAAAANLVDMAVAAMLGVSVLIVFGIYSPQDIVSAGICGSHGKPVSFMRFMRYGVPVTLVQIGVAALYVMALFYMVDR